MKLCLMILSVPAWYMFNRLEHTAILSHFLTFITGSSSRLLRIRFSADLDLYWFPVCHFLCKEFNPLVIWMRNQNIAISTIVGTSSHIRLVWIMVFNATFNNISVISWWSVLLVEETGVPGKNYRSVVSH